MIFSLQYIPYIYIYPYYVYPTIPWYQNVSTSTPCYPMGQALRDSNKADLEKRLLEEQVSDSKAGTKPIGSRFFQNGPFKTGGVLLDKSTMKNVVNGFCWL